MKLYGHNINLSLILSLLLILTACANGQNNATKRKKTMHYTHTNALINESSPYLLQHAHNPVNWHPWNKATLALAKKENKPLIVSIGYSSCHWCHVMEHQSFENEEVAKLMNDNFICIKVDREEHPDVDQIYMNAVQLITGRGGWPLNCFALPDGKPFYGGTYFNREQWISVLKQIINLYQNKHLEALKYAASIEKGILAGEQITKVQSATNFNKKDLNKMLDKWVLQFDYTEGGSKRAPKFPLPNNYRFLMRYASQENDKIIDDQVKLTLDKMYHGGIYDQLGGGFARYSTDKMWKVPHFEKMLYDNAQLISLYSDAYKNYGNKDYKRIIIETIDFVNREMTNGDGLFFSALDADSDGKEGKYYVWTKEEIEKILQQQAPLFEDFYEMNSKGHWEENNYILLRSTNISSLARKYHLNESEIEQQINHDKELLMHQRNQRVKPGLDDKSLISWNAMMVSAYCDAFTALGDTTYLSRAQKAMDFILDKMTKQEGGLWHTYKNGEAKINAYLDDYGHTIGALVRLFEVGAGDKYLYEANKLAQYSIDKFYDNATGMFFYTSSEDEVLVSRKTEIYDNVIPSSNSVIARDLFKLSHYFDNDNYLHISEQMLKNIKPQLSSNPSSLSNWGFLLMDFVGPVKEVVVDGKEAKRILHQMQKNYLPQVIWASDNKENTKISLLQNRYVQGKTYIYICINKSCELPLEEESKALEMIKQ